MKTRTSLVTLGLLVTLTDLGTLALQITLLHVNDVHSRFEQTSVYSGRCSENEEQTGNCFGGFARIYSKINEIRKTRPNTIFLSGGDYFQGTIWYTIHKWKIMVHFLNLLNHTAMSLGNHEFDDGVGGLVPFLERVTFPVLAANIEDKNEPTIKGKYKKSVVIQLEGRKVGIIGYVTTETMMIATTGRLNITDEVEAVRIEAKRLAAEGVSIIIALGHAGYKRDIDIAREVEEVDFVVGGHTNTFLYSGDPPSTESAVGEYPKIVVQSSGKKVPVVQAYAFGKYLGYVELDFDDHGNLKSWKGNPILLGSLVRQDPFILNELKPWRAGVENVVSKDIGRTFVLLDGSRLSCRMVECNLGNLLADAVVHMNAKYPDNLEWARTGLAVVNGGGVRTSIDEKASNGTVTLEDILTVAPFQNTIDIVELKGQHVKEMFERSVNQYDGEGLDAPGRFLQVSGFIVAYDMTQPPGSRVVSLEARCTKCRIPKFEKVEAEAVYKIAMPAYIANGGDGYSVIKDNKIKHHLTGLLDTDAYTQYIKLYSPIYQGLENRIIMNSDHFCSELLQSNRASYVDGKDALKWSLLLITVCLMCLFS